MPDEDLPPNQTPEELRWEAHRLIEESTRLRQCSEELMRQAKRLLELAAAASEQDAPGD